MILEQIKNKISSDEGATQTVETIIAIAFVVMIAVVIFAFWGRIADDQTNATQAAIGDVIKDVNEVTTSTVVTP